jgi:signal transduction histidine kinase/CheY-like chemotaxis protein
MVHPVEPAVLVATLQALIRARTAEDQCAAASSASARSTTRRRAASRCWTARPLRRRQSGAAADARGRASTWWARPSRFAPAEWRGLVADRVSRSPATGGAPWRGEFPLLAPDGRGAPGMEHLLARRTGRAHRHRDRRLGAHELEQRRRDVLEREQAARVVAERHSRTKDDFIAVLSHELRTPLNAIVGWVHILKRRGVAPEAMKGIDAIERNVKTQARIISDILDVSRINSGKLRLDREWADPAELVSSSIEALTGSINEKRLRVDTDLEGAHQPAWLDPARFQQIFWNLMTNAIKFSPDGGRVAVRLQREGDRLLLEVQDFGQGIAATSSRTCSTASPRATRPATGRTAAWGSACRSSSTWWTCMAATVAAESEGAGQGTTHAGGPAGGAERRQRPPPMRPKRGRAWSSTSATCACRARRAGGGGRPRSQRDDDGGAGRPRRARAHGARLRQRAAALQQAWPDVLVSDIGLPGRDGYELVRRVREIEPRAAAAPAGDRAHGLRAHRGPAQDAGRRLRPAPEQAAQAAPAAGGDRALLPAAIGGWHATKTLTFPVAA